ncbi:LysE family transporter [Clostridioides difficile]
MIVGISAGFVCVMIICALGCFGLSKFIPTLIDTMKYIGAIYIIYLAIHATKSKPSDENKTQTKSFWSWFILQFVNVKIILYGSLFIWDM